MIRMRGSACTCRVRQPGRGEHGQFGRRRGACRARAACRPRGSRARACARSGTARRRTPSMTVRIAVRDLEPLDRHDAVAAARQHGAGHRPRSSVGRVGELERRSAGGLRRRRRGNGAARRARTAHAKAMPSIVTRSNGGWSRSARTDCASTAPASAASGRELDRQRLHAFADQGLGLGGRRQCPGIHHVTGPRPAWTGPRERRAGRPTCDHLAACAPNAFFSSFQRVTSASSSSSAALCFLAWITSSADFFEARSGRRGRARRSRPSSPGPGTAGRCPARTGRSP